MRGQIFRETRLKKPNSSQGEGGKPRVTSGMGIRPRPIMIAELPKAKHRVANEALGVGS